MIYLEKGFVRYRNGNNQCVKNNLSDFAYQSNYSVEEISLLLGISSRQLERIFHDSLGISPKAWLREQRVVRAKQWLQSGQSAKFIFYNLGFKNQSHFIREFRYYYDMTPYEFMQIVKKRQETDPLAA